jgi:DNA-binding response OmpR family regulator
MTDMPLAGRAVLVVDDDFFIADIAREVLEEAGATVLGPFGHEDQAIASLQDHSPQCAALDLNLGTGPSFVTARVLKMRGVPMVLVTGYDESIIPVDLAGTPCLQKPVSSARLIAAVTDLLG